MIIIDKKIHKLISHIIKNAKVKSMIYVKDKTLLVSDGIRGFMLTGTSLSDGLYELYPPTTNVKTAIQIVHDDEPEKNSRMAKKLRGYFPSYCTANKDYQFITEPNIDITSVVIKNSLHHKKIIPFNTKYLMPFLRLCQDKRVEIIYNDNKESVMCLIHGNYWFIIMPCMK